MDTATLQMFVFGSIVVLVGAFATYMGARQQEREGKRKSAEPKQLL